MNKIPKHYLILLLILIVAAALRFYKLNAYPVGLHIDEASLGYNGYSFLKSGKDEHGIRFPLYIDMFGDFRPSGYHYLTVLPIAFFGLNELATRFPGAFFGTITVLAVYVLSYAAFRNRALSLTSSFLIAIAPWHVNLSRASAETIVALFFIIFGFGLLIEGMKKRSYSMLFFAAVSLSLSYFFYHTPRIFVPLMFIAIVLSHARELLEYMGSRYRRFATSVFLTGVWLFLLSFLLIFVVKGGSGRFKQVSIFGFPETKLVLEEQIREDGTQSMPVFATRFFHNKVLNYAVTYVTNYFEYFTGEYLFIKGGLPIWYKVPNIGLIYLVESPFFLLGFVALFKDKNKFSKIFLFWLLLAPVVAAITYDDSPNIQRSIPMFLAVEIITAYGLIQFAGFRNRIATAILILFSFALSFNVFYFMHQYFIHTKTHDARYRNNGFKEMVLSMNNVYGQYDHFIVTKSLGGIYPNVLFYAKYDPATYQKEGSPKDPDYGGFGKYFFVPQACPSINGDDRYPTSGKIVYINNGTCDIPNENAQKIYREDGTLAFIIVYR